MFERWTERARQVVVLAKDEANKLPSEAIGVEHMLLGCMVEGEGLAARSLAELQVTADDLRAVIPPTTTGRTNVEEQTPFTPRAKKVMERALREALSMGHNYIGTEHILMAISHEPSPTVDRFMRDKLGDNWQEVVYLDTLEILSGPRPVAGEVDLNQEERQELKLKDVLADILTGFNMWKEAKQLNAEDWTDVDEAFSRWIDGAGLSEFL